MSDTLLPRLRAATGPDRGLDAEIALAHGWQCLNRGETIEWWREPNKPEGTWAMFPPAFTSSIDAAVTLIPEDYIRRTSQCRFGAWRVELWRGDVSFNEKPTVDVLHVTEPLAICIAALMARGEPT